MLDDLVWSPPSTPTDLNEVVAEVMQMMDKTPSLEAFVGYYDMGPQEFSDHVETIVKETYQKWKESHPDDLDGVGESMYILGVLTGITLQKRRTSGEGNQS